MLDLRFREALSILAVGLSLASAACVPDVANEIPGQNLGTSASGSASQSCTSTCYVSNTGNDVSGDGSSGNPFATITYALSLATAGATVQVNPGNYTTGSGETFPLYVPANVALIGDEPNKGNGGTSTTVSGTGLVAPAVTDNTQGNPAEAAVVAGTGSTIAGLAIAGVAPTGSNSGDLIVIVYPVTTVIIRNNTLSGAHDNGILEQAAGNNTINSNIIIFNGFSGFASYCSATGTPACIPGSSTGDSFQQNGIGHNASYGLYFQNTAGGGTYDLGGGGVSAGVNTICNNPTTGLLVNIFPGATIFAQSNQWITGPPSVVTTITTATDVINNNGNSTVDTSGYFPTSACPY